MHYWRGLHHGPNKVEGLRKAMENKSGLSVSDGNSGCRNRLVYVEYYT
jgi:hypothetical protein